MDIWIGIGIFVALLFAPFYLLSKVPPRYSIDKMKETDYRVVLFTLRLALAFGIGAVVVGALLVVSQLLF
jgi:hypothetical protein